ncbi:MAG: hypothetical protein WD118_05040 [Phycisphaeraceae bacterium]
MTRADDNPDAQQQWLLHGDLPCLGCQYNLRGLVGPVVKCPECGHANDLGDPTPWRKKKLPTGVRIREHWPATAALASFIVMVVLPLAISSAITIGLNWPQFDPFLPALLPFPMLAMVLAWWALMCLRWLRSCQNKRWGWSVLIGTHLAMWGTLFGAVGCVAVFVDPNGMLALSPLPVAILTASVLTFFWLRRIIRHADRTGQFRNDWRKWQLPTGEPASTSDDATR